MGSGNEVVEYETAKVQSTCIGDGEFSWLPDAEKLLAKIKGIAATDVYAAEHWMVVNGLTQAEANKAGETFSMLVLGEPATVEETMKLQEIFDIVVDRYQIRLFQHAISSAVSANESYIGSDTVLAMAESATMSVSSRVKMEGFELNRSMLTDQFKEVELEVIQEALNGKTSKGIAESVFLSKSTTASILSRIYKKMNVKNRTQLVYQCFTRGYVRSK